MNNSEYHNYLIKNYGEKAIFPRKNFNKLMDYISNNFDVKIVTDDITSEHELRMKIMALNIMHSINAYDKENRFIILELDTVSQKNEYWYCLFDSNDTIYVIVEESSLEIESNFDLLNNHLVINIGINENEIDEKSSEYICHLAGLQLYENHLNNLTKEMDNKRFN